MIIYSQKYYNKYSQIVKHYKDLDLKKSKDVYTENHHILPKSMGGSDKKDNLVRVPAKVHFLLHWMLYRIYKTPEMAYAWHSMCRSTNRKRYTSKSYQYARIAHANAVSIVHIGKIVSEETRNKISLASKGKPKSKESNEKKSLYMKGKPSRAKGYKHTEETKKKLSIFQSNRIRKPHTEETKKKLSDINSGKILSEETKIKIAISSVGRTKVMPESAKHKLSIINKNIPESICPHCNKVGRGNAMKQWHFNNCKYVK